MKTYSTLLEKTQVIYNFLQDFAYTEFLVIIGPRDSGKSLATKLAIELQAKNRNSIPVIDSEFDIDNYISQEDVMPAIFHLLEYNEQIIKKMYKNLGRQCINVVGFV